MSESAPLATVTPHEAPLLWPLHGVVHFAKRPGLWGKPLLGTFLAWLATIAVALGAMAVTWPAVLPDGFWAVIWAYMSPFLWAGLAFVSIWLLFLPVVMGLIYEGLARRIMREQGCQLRELDLLRGGVAGAIMVGRTLPWRLGWLAAGLLISLIAPPIGLAVAAVGLGHVALLDASDICFGLLGCDVSTRARLLKRHRQELLSAGAVAGAVGHLLGLTVIGWLLWMPGLMVGAAMVCPRWLAEDRAA